MEERIHLSSSIGNAGNIIGNNITSAINGLSVIKKVLKTYLKNAVMESMVVHPLGACGYC